MTVFREYLSDLYFETNWRPQRIWIDDDGGSVENEESVMFDGCSVSTDRISWCDWSDASLSSASCRKWYLRAKGLVCACLTTPLE